MPRLARISGRTLGDLLTSTLTIADGKVFTSIPMAATAPGGIQNFVPPANPNDKQKG